MEPIIESEFEYRGHPCVVMFMPWGLHRCGYVGIQKGTLAKVKNIECHGGITYKSGGLYKQDRKDVWWIGFDTAHCYDARDFETCRRIYKDNPDELYRILLLDKLDHDIDTGGVVRTQEFCENECKKIVDQLEEKNATL